MIVKHGSSGIEIEIAFKGKAHSLMGDLGIKEVDIKPFMIKLEKDIVALIGLKTAEHAEKWPRRDSRW
mgnify:CR=1 FL=1